jgi:hypothetical protein
MYFLHRLACHALTVMAGLSALLTPVIMLTLVMSGTNVDLIGQPFMPTSAPHTAPSHSPAEALTTVGLVLGNNPAAHKGLHTEIPTAEPPVHLVSAVTYCGSACDGTDTGGGTHDSTSHNGGGGNDHNGGSDNGGGSSHNGGSFDPDPEPCNNQGHHHYSSSSTCPTPDPEPCNNQGHHHYSSNSTCPTPDCDQGHHYSNNTCSNSLGDEPPRWQPEPPRVIVVPPAVVRPPIAQPPVVHLPVEQPPVVQPPVEQPAVEQPPVAPPPVKPVAVPTAHPSAAPVVDAPVAPLGFFKLLHRSWLVIVALILLGVGLLARLMVLHALRNQHGQKWARARIQLVAGADPGVGVEVMESRTDHSPPTCVVRLQPYADSGTQILEEVHS